MYDVKHESKKLVSHGVSTCAGCGLELIFRVVTDALGDDVIVVIPPGCSSLFCGFGRETAMKLAGYQCNLENCAAVCSGIKAGLEVQGNYHTTVLGFAGDGATIDIGLQSLSGVMERGDRIIYVCYDNEAYMNTGIQGSGSTPYMASTTTTPAGKPTPRKDLVAIAMAHGIPYAASASAADPVDLRKKVLSAKESGGPALIHVHSPCPPGWGISPEKSIEVAKKAVSTGAWALYEYRDNRIVVNRKLKELAPIGEYMSMQKRFAHITDAEIELAQKTVTDSYMSLLARSEQSAGGK